MADIVMADDGIAFDGRLAESAPMGGAEAAFVGLAEALASEPPPPRALFTSKPLRGLAWLLDVWERRIRPRVPEGELHLFSGPRTYGAAGARKEAAMLPVLERAAAMAAAGVVLREPV